MSESMEGDKRKGEWKRRRGVPGETMIFLDKLKRKKVAATVPTGLSLSLVSKI
jgi:hypothetical protein